MVNLHLYRKPPAPPVPVTVVISIKQVGMTSGQILVSKVLLAREGQETVYRFKLSAAGAWCGRREQPAQAPARGGPSMTAFLLFAPGRGLRATLWPRRIWRHAGS